LRGNVVAWLLSAFFPPEDTATAHFPSWIAEMRKGCRPFTIVAMIDSRFDSLIFLCNGECNRMFGIFSFPGASLHRREKLRDEDIRKTSVSRAHLLRRFSLIVARIV